jgi:uncharacterized membrane protein
MAGFANLRFLKVAGLFGGLNIILSITIVVFYVALIIVSFKKFIEINKLKKAKKQLMESSKAVDKEATAAQKDKQIKEWNFLTEEVKPQLENNWKFILHY